MDEEEDEEDLYVADAEYLIVLRVGTGACFFFDDSTHFSPSFFTHRFVITRGESDRTNVATNPWKDTC